MIPDLISCVVDLVELYQVPLVVSVNCQVLRVHNSQLLPLPALRVDREDLVAFLQLKVAELNDLRVEHHLEHPLGAPRSRSHHVQVVARILVLESADHGLPLLAHLGARDLSAPPSGHKVNILWREDLQVTVLVDGHYLNGGNLEPLRIVRLLTELV